MASFALGGYKPGTLRETHTEYCAETEASTLSELIEACGYTFYSLTELVQVMHWTILAQFDLVLGALHSCCRTKGLFQCEHYFIHLRKAFLDIKLK